MTFTRKLHVHLSVLTVTTATLIAPLLVAGLPMASSAEPEVSLRSESDSALSSATVEVPTNRVVRTDPFSMIAATWSGDDPGVSVRTRSEGRWTDWVPLEELHDGPSGDEARAASDRGASDLRFVGASDRVQVRTESTAENLEMVFIDPGVEAGDDDAAALAPEEKALATTSATRRTVSKPAIRTRRQWGADESWRNGSPSLTTNFRQMHVHHTVNANDYASWQVAGIIRGIYRYHTKSLGWSDIGYNFLIDRFGRTWEGRAGGVSRLVRGAHTLGFNHGSTGVAVIGNYETRTVSSTVLKALADLGAWKFDANDRYPVGKVTMTSSGSDKFPKYTKVSLYKIDGHRDTNDTSCPGRYLYAKLPQLRSMIYNRMYTS